MDDPNITMEEYIRLEEENRTFNRQTATFEKIENYEDKDDCFINFEAEFPAIVFDNTLTSDTTLPCEPTVSPPNENKIDFRISLDESDDEDYMVIFDENSFSYKIISINDLKTDSENDNMPSSPKPTVDYLDDLDFFNDFKNEFPPIVYNDGLTSKLDLTIEPSVSSERINKFETTLSEYDKEEQNVLHFSDSFPPDVFFSNDPKMTGDKEFHTIKETIHHNTHEKNVYPPILNINYFSHFLNILRNYDPMDDEPMWAADRAVAPTLGSAITIPETANKFSIKALFDRLLGEIQAFYQHENESLTDAWLRMKEMLRNCHGHNLSKGNIIKIFYHGLSEITQEVLNVAAGGIFLYKTPNQAYQLLKDKVLLKLDWAKTQKTKSSLKKTVAFVAESSSNTDTDKIMARMDAMTIKMDAQYKELQSRAKNQHPTLTKMTCPCLVKKRLNSCKLSSQQSTNAFVKDTFMDLKTQLETVAKNHQALIQNLETKFDRLADKQSGRPSRSLPSNTQPNPKGHNPKSYQPPQSRNEHVNAVFTRSGKTYDPPDNLNDQQNNSETPINFESDDEDEEPTPQPKTQPTKPVKETSLPKPYKPKIPYPQRLRKEKMEAQYGKFLDMIRAVRINVPLVDVLAGMPNYGKFLKELISNKHKIEQISASFLSDESSAIIQNKLPPKLGDPGSFLIPFNFKTFSYNALADIGASINLMPYSLYAKLSLESLKPTTMSVRLADRSFQYPVGIDEKMH
ncbi:reverse transcriptase domain-containing protein [Tanacetum coccineum]